ncbi:MAG: hypothetical protein LBH95_08180 [Oscillospiraceae bacterium]|nr:hypothetical protein [Oscillospiraceae bacterium]
MGTQQLRTKEAREMCEDNYGYFTEHLDELVAQYPEQFVVIKNRAVIGSYGSFDEAYQETVKTEPLGTFLIQQCAGDSRTYTAYFANHNAAFAR